MDDQNFVLEVLVLLVLAGFLVHKLRKELGKRHGHERPRSNPFTAANDMTPDASGTAAETWREAPAGAEPEPRSDQGIDAVKRADRSFDAETFLDGAKEAFEIVVRAFSEGDRSMLRSLVAPSLRRVFEEEIARRESEGTAIETVVRAFHDSKITTAEVMDGWAVITVRFVSDQAMIVRDAEGEVVEGSLDEHERVTDEWVFARQIGAADPTWQVVETRVVS